MRRNLITTLAIILLIGGGSAAVYATDTYGVRSQLDSRVARAGVQVLEGDVQNRTLKEFGLLSEKNITLPITGRLIDYVPEGYAITINNEQGTWNVESLGDQKTFATGPNSKLWLGVSPNGRYLSYAERAPLEPIEGIRAALDVYNPAQWHARVLDLETEHVLMETKGSMPRFFEREGSTHLLYLLPNEVRIRVLGTPREFILPYQIDGLWPAEVSADGKYIALFNVERMSYEVFTFELTDGAVVLAPLPSMPVQVRILTFKGTDLYASAWLPAEERAELIVIDLENPGSYTVLSDRKGLEHVRRIIPAL